MFKYAGFVVKCMELSSLGYLSISNKPPYDQVKFRVNLPALEACLTFSS